MPDFYNEWEPYPAQWIRNLIAAGELPEGTVDERDIRDVQPAELKGYTQVHLMAGIGGWPYALRLAGWPATEPVWTASLPCQPFSTAGHGRGTDDERHLWPTVAKLIAANRPPIIFGEQVASAAGRTWWDGVAADLEAMGYSCRAVDISAAGVGAPHIRQRLYWVAVDNADAGRREQSNQTICSGGVSPEPTGSRDMANTTSQRLRKTRQSITRDTTERVTGPSAPHSRDMADPERHRQYGGGGMAEPGGWDESTDRGTDRRDVADTGDNERGGRSAVRETPAMDDGAAGANETSGGGGSSPSRIRPIDESSDGSTSYRQRLGNTDIQRPQGRWIGGKSPSERTVWPSGMGAWADAVWIECADGKRRRIPNPETQPGIYPLAYGVPGRVGRLRAYGNAIVPQVAATFIQAVMETLEEEN